MSQYLRKVRTASGATGVQVVDKKGGRGTILEHLGSAHSEAELAVLMEAGRTRLAGGQQVLGLEHLACPGSSGLVAVAGQRHCELLWQVLTHACSALGLDEAARVDEAFKQMVLARLVEPSGKADTIRVLTELGIKPVSLRTLLRSLARCAEQDWRGGIQHCLYQRVHAHGDLPLALHVYLPGRL